MKITLATGEEGLELILEADTIEEKMSPIKTLEAMEEVLRKAVELGLVIDEELVEMLEYIEDEEDE